MSLKTGQKIESPLRTVALQVGKMHFLNGKYVTKATKRFFTPDYSEIENVIDRNCMSTYLDDTGYHNSPRYKKIEFTMYTELIHVYSNVPKPNPKT